MGFGTLILMHGLFLLMQAFSDDNGRGAPFFSCPASMNNNSSAFFITSDDVVPSCCKARKIIDSSVLFPNPKNDKCKSSSAAFTAVV